jgi:4'-phosphopantetheinyl transferase
MEFEATLGASSPGEFSLDGTEVVIWRAALDCAESALQTLEATLSQDEKRRADRFHFPQDRAHFVAARGILRKLIGAYLLRDPVDLRFRYGPQGKPQLEPHNSNQSLAFNVSHKHGLAVYTFARGRNLGIDLEAIAPEFPGEEIARRFFSRRELEELLALPPDSRAEGFFLGWTRKEAYIKARGQGLQIQLDSFSVCLTPGEPAGFRSGVAPEWQMISFALDRDHPCAVVCDGPRNPRVRLLSVPLEFAL